MQTGRFYQYTHTYIFYLMLWQFNYYCWRAWYPSWRIWKPNLSVHVLSYYAINLMLKLNKKDQKKMVYSTCNYVCNLIMLFYLVIWCPRCPPPVTALAIWLCYFTLLSGAPVACNQACNLIMSYIKAMVSPYLKFLAGYTSARDLQCNIGDAQQDHGVILMAHKGGGF